MFCVTQGLHKAPACGTVTEIEGDVCAPDRCDMEEPFRFRDKIMFRHQVAPSEVEEVVFGKPFIVKIARGKVRNEHVYEAYGQTQAGRYLVVFFINKGNAALPISARDMTDAERKYYREKGK